MEVWTDKVKGLGKTLEKKQVKCKDLSLKSYRMKGFLLDTYCLKRLGIFNLTFTNRQIGSWGFSEKFFCFLFPLFKTWIKYLADL